jgi:hypothetical protein
MERRRVAPAVTLRAGIVVSFFAGNNALQSSYLTTTDWTTWSQGIAALSRILRYETWRIGALQAYDHPLGDEHKFWSALADMDAVIRVLLAVG